MYFKVPEGCYRRSVEQDILLDVIAWYKIKKYLGSSGYTSKANLIRKCRGLGSRSTIYRIVSNLIDLKLIKRINSGYQISSYDALFKTLGYNLSVDNKKGRKGEFKIHKLEWVDIKKQLAFVEIRDNLKKQRFAAWKKLGDQRPEPKQRVHKLSFLRKMSGQAHMIDTQIKNADLSDYADSIGESIKELNTDITLGYKGIARILGVGLSEAFRIMKELCDYGYLSSTKREFAVQYFSGSKEEFRKLYPSFKYFLRRSVVYRQMANLIVY